MRGQRLVSRGQRPDVDIVDDGDARQFLDHAAQAIDVDVPGNALQQHVDHLGKQAPGAQQNQDGHHGAGDRVGDIPVVGPDQDRRHHNRHRTQQIGDHVPVGRLDVDAVSGGGVQHPGDQGVDAEPDGPDDQHQSTLDIVIVIAGDAARDAVVGLQQDQCRDDPQGEGVRQRRQDLRAMVAEGALRGRRAGGEVNGEQGEPDRRRVGEHVSGVRQQRKASRQHAADDVDEHVAQLHDHGDREGADARPAQLIDVIAVVVGVAAGAGGHHGPPGMAVRFRKGPPRAGCIMGAASPNRPRRTRPAVHQRVCGQRVAPLSAGGPRVPGAGPRAGGCPPRRPPGDGCRRTPGRSSRRRPPGTRPVSRQ